VRPPEAEAAWRKAERARLIAARLALSPQARADAARAIEAALEAGFPPSGIALVGAYWPIRG
jgi:5-formyltetrahydrofolate cyclo-ligase